VSERDNRREEKREREERERKRVRDKLKEGERGRMWESNKFPSVHINPQNVSGSWDDFWTEFSIAMELQCLEISETGLCPIGKRVLSF